MENISNNQKEDFIPFYIEVKQKENRYDIYIVNDTNKEYFVYQTYSKEPIKAKTKLLLEKRSKQDNDDYIYLWLTDDTSETYHLRFGGIFSSSKKHFTKIENCFHTVEKLKVHDKQKDEYINKLAKENYKLIDVVNINRKKLLTHLKEYLDTYKDYEVRYKYDSMTSIIDMFQTLSLIDDAQFLSSEYLLSLQKYIINSKVQLDEKELSFLTLTQKQKDEMLVSVQISYCPYCFYAMLEVDLITYFEKQNYIVKSEDEIGMDRHHWRKSHHISHSNTSFRVDSIYNWDDMIDYYIIAPIEIFRNYLLEFVLLNKKAPFNIRYISKDEQTPYEEEKISIESYPY